MQMPGFTAEASLYQTRVQYRSTLDGGYQGKLSLSVYPQQCTVESWAFNEVLIWPCMSTCLPVIWNRGWYMGCVTRCLAASFVWDPSLAAVLTDCFVRQQTGTLH
jgi:hypothetical protein